MDDHYPKLKARRLQKEIEKRDIISLSLFYSTI